MFQPIICSDLPTKKNAIFNPPLSAVGFVFAMDFKRSAKPNFISNLVSASAPSPRGAGIFHL